MSFKTKVAARKEELRKAGYDPVKEASDKLKSKVNEWNENPFVRLGSALSSYAYRKIEHRAIEYAAKATIATDQITDKLSKEVAKYEVLAEDLTKRIEDK